MDTRIYEYSSNSIPFMVCTYTYERRPREMGAPPATLGQGKCLACVRRLLAFGVVLLLGENAISNTPIALHHHLLSLRTN